MVLEVSAKFGISAALIFCICNYMFGMYGQMEEEDDSLKQMHQV